jgi:hypothetical protein
VTNSVFTYTLPPLSVVTFVGQAVPLLISIQQATTNVVLSWLQGTLLSATNLTGPWTTNSATSPYTNPAISPHQFYRLLVRPAAGFFRFTRNLKVTSQDFTYLGSCFY